MNGLTGGVTRLRGRTKDGEVEIVRVGDIEHVTINIAFAVALEITLSFISEFDGSPVRSGTGLIIIYDKDFIVVPAVITEKEIRANEYKYTIAIPKTYGADGSGGTSGTAKRTPTMESRFYIQYGVVTENHLSHVVCTKNFTDYADWMANGSVREGIYTVKVPYFKAGVMQTNKTSIMPSESIPLETALPMPYKFGPDSITWAEGYLASYNEIQQYPSSYGPFSRISDTINVSISLECSDSVIPRISATLLCKNAGIVPGSPWMYYNDENVWQDHLSDPVTAYLWYSNQSTIKPDYWLYGPQIEWSLTSDILTDQTYLREESPTLPGYEIFGHIPYEQYGDVQYKDGVKSGSMSFQYNTTPITTYSYWSGSAPMVLATVRFLEAQFTVEMAASYSGMNYIKNT
jgi:hypothetical protein